MIDDDDLWLDLPQAVVLVTTWDIELAVGLTAETPILLIAKANRLVARRTEVPLAEDADQATRLAVIKEFQEVKVAALADSRYLEAEERIVQCLIGGARSSARRRPGGPYESVDAVEYTAVELQGVDAIDKRTRSAILFDLRISAVDLVERLTGQRITQPGAARSATGNQIPEDAPTESEKWEGQGDPLPRLLEWAQARWGADSTRLPNRFGLLEVFRDQFGPVSGINEKTMRGVRRALAPPKTRRGGASMHRSRP
jgi:hypothetical protein